MIDRKEALEDMASIQRLMSNEFSRYVVKKCASCGRKLEPRFFHSNARTKDGLTHKCKFCIQSTRTELNAERKAGRKR